MPHHHCSQVSVDITMGNISSICDQASSGIHVITLQLSDACRASHHVQYSYQYSLLLRYPKPRLYSAQFLWKDTFPPIRLWNTVQPPSFSISQYTCVKIKLYVNALSETGHGWGPAFAGVRSSIWHPFRSTFCWAKSWASPCQGVKIVYPEGTSTVDKPLYSQNTTLLDGLIQQVVDIHCLPHQI